MHLLSDYLFNGGELPTYDNEIVIEDGDVFQKFLSKHFDEKYLNWCNDLQTHMKKSLTTYEGENDNSCLVRYLKIRLVDKEGNMISVNPSINIEGQKVNRFPGEPVSLDTQNATATIDFGAPARIRGISATDTLTITPKFPGYYTIVKDFKNLTKLSKMIEQCSEYANGSIVNGDKDFNPIRASFSNYLANEVSGTKYSSKLNDLIDTMVDISNNPLNGFICPKSIAALALAQELIKSEYGMEFYEMYTSTNSFVNDIEKQMDDEINNESLIELVENHVKEKSFDIDISDDDKVRYGAYAR
jgi:hypothetical protein